MNYRNYLTGKLQQVILLMLSFFLVRSVEATVSIPTSLVSLTGLTANSSSTISGTPTLIKWRNKGIPATSWTGATPPVVSSMTFQYLTGTSLLTPTRSIVKDNTANNEGDLWADEAIDMSYTKANSIGTGTQAILIYTNNTDNGSTDPLYNVSLRGGLIGQSGGTISYTDGARASVLPLIWKVVASSDLYNAQTADVTSAATVISSGPVVIPEEITSLTGGSCDTLGSYAAATRTNNGFCDFSTHYVTDMNNNIHNPSGAGKVSNSWYSQYAAGSTNYLGAYNYASVVNAFGASTTESGIGSGTMNPAFILLGANISNALRVQYQTTIYLDSLTQ